MGFRIPDHISARTLISRIGVPILAPSANFSGEATPFRTSEINPQLAKLVDFVLAGRCSLKKASTVIDCTKKPWKVIRQGAVKIVNGQS